jgi:hypothetical protein
MIAVLRKMAKLSSKAVANRWLCGGYHAEMMESFIQKGDTYVRLLIWHVDRFRAEPTERGALESGGC